MLRSIQPINRFEIDLVRKATDIVKLVEKYTALKPNTAVDGGYWSTGTGKLSRLFVHGGSQMFFDFATGARGDVFAFLCNYGLGEFSFREAVLVLAKEAGIELDAHKENAPNSPLVSKNRLLEINQWAKLFFHQNLVRDGCRLNELESSRNIDRSIVDMFSIGYADGSYNTFVKYAHASSFKNLELLFSGLVRRPDKRSKYYAALRDRLVIPITNLAGEVVGFAHQFGLSEMGKQPWLLSMSNALFKPNRILFGLKEAKEEMERRNFVYMAANYLQVFELHKLSVSNVVCLCGDDFTEFHAHSIKPICDTVVFLDGVSDSSANNRRKKAMVANGLHVDVLSIELGNALALSKNGDEFHSLIERNKLPYMLTLLNKALLNKAAAPEKRYEEILAVISTIKDHETRREFMQTFFNRLELDKENEDKLIETIVLKSCRRNAVHSRLVERVIDIRENSRGEFEILKFFFLPESELRWLGGWRALVHALKDYEFQVTPLKVLYQYMKVMFLSGITPSLEEFDKLDAGVARTAKRFRRHWNKIDLRPLGEYDYRISEEFVTLINKFKLEIIKNRIEHYQAFEAAMKGIKGKIGNLREYEKMYTQFGCTI